MICFGLVCSLMIISHIITLILLVSNCISKKEPKKESSDVLPKGQENNQNSHKENKHRNESNAPDFSNVDFIRRSEILRNNSQNLKHHKMQHKINRHYLREEVKDELPPDNSSNIAMNLRGRSHKGEFANRIYMRDRNDPILSTTENKSPSPNNSSLFSNKRQKYFQKRQKYFNTKFKKKL